MHIRKMALVLIGGLFALTPRAHADIRDDVVSGIQRCGVIHDNRVWLDCVYGAVQPMRGQLGLQPAPEFQQRLVPPPQIGMAPVPAYSTPPAAPAAPPAPKPRRKVGFFGNLIGLAPPVAASRMASYTFEKGGGFLVTLDNGQQWRQTEIEGGTPPWTKPASDYQVTIIQGAFGSYSLRTSDDPRLYKVAPVK